MLCSFFAFTIWSLNAREQNSQMLNAELCKVRRWWPGENGSVGFLWPLPGGGAGGLCSAAEDSADLSPTVWHNQQRVGRFRSHICIAVGDEELTSSIIKLQTTKTFKDAQHDLSNQQEVPKIWLKKKRKCVNKFLFFLFVFFLEAKRTIAWTWNSNQLARYSHVVWKMIYIQSQLAVAGGADEAPLWILSKNLSLIPTSAPLTLQRRAYSKSNVKQWNSLYFSAVFLRRTLHQAKTATLPFLVTCWQTAATAAPLMIDIRLEFCYIFHNCRDLIFSIFLVFFVGHWLTGSFSTAGFFLVNSFL